MKPESIFDNSFIFHAYSYDQYPKIENTLELLKCAIYDFNASHVIDQKSLFQALFAVFAPNELFPGESSWDSMFDRIWHIVSSQPSQRVVIIVRSFDHLLFTSVQLTLEFLDVFHRLSRLLERNPCWQEARSITLRIILLGQAPSYHNE
jgi:hypothetical protein